MFCPRCLSTFLYGTSACAVCGFGGAPLATKDPFIGRSLSGQYTLLRRLGEGGACIVYLAEQRGVERFVAVKLLAPQMAASPLLSARFRREAQILARLSHPCVVKLLSTGGTEDGALWNALEYLHGETLAARLERKPRLHLQEALPLFKALCGALAEAHEKQIIHRDIKPENIFLSKLHSQKILPKLIDFGLSGAITETPITNTGMWGGSSAYMSPEHWRGLKYVDARSDIYSLGVVLYRSLAGRLPFEAKGRMDWVAKHLHEPVPPLGQGPDNKRLPEALDEVISIAMAKEPAQRYQNVTELWSALSSALTQAIQLQQSPTLRLVKPTPQKTTPAKPTNQREADLAALVETAAETPAPTLITKDEPAPPAEQGSTRVYRRDPRVLRPISAHQEKALWLRGICGHPSGILFVVGSHGALYRSINGAPFSPLQSGVSAHLNAAWSQERQLCAVGANGVVVSSDDAGESFTEHQNEERPWLWSIWGDREGNRFAVGENGAFLSSRDKGQRWRLTSLATQLPLYSIWGEVHGASSALYVTGKRGLFLRSFNAGVSWEQREVPTEQDLLAIWGDRNGELVAVGRGGVMLRSKNRGQSFEKVELPSKTTLYSVFGVGQARYAVGDNGLFLHSPNGAEWRSERVGSSALYGLCGSAQTLVAVGNGGALVQFSLPEPKALQENARKTPPPIPSRGLSLVG